MVAVMIGVDPHKGSHTAVVISAAEEPLGEIRVRASAGQAEKLVAWAAGWPDRTWAVEGAAGLGRLLAQQLVAAGEQVLDVQPKLASRVRLLQAGDTNKNDPNDALSVAVAALRSRTRRQVTAEDYRAVLKVWSKRHRDLSRLRNQVACRLHAVLCDLVPGGHPKEITAAHAARILEQAAPSGPVAVAHRRLVGGAQRFVDGGYPLEMAAHRHLRHLPPLGLPATVMRSPLLSSHTAHPHDKTRSPTGAVWRACGARQGHCAGVMRCDERFKFPPGRVVSC